MPITVQFCWNFRFVKGLKCTLPKLLEPSVLRLRFAVIWILYKILLYCAVFYWSHTIQDKGLLLFQRCTKSEIYYSVCYWRHLSNERELLLFQICKWNEMYCSVYYCILNSHGTIYCNCKIPHKMISKFLYVTGAYSLKILDSCYSKCVQKLKCTGLYITGSFTLTVLNCWYYKAVWKWTVVYLMLLVPSISSHRSAVISIVYKIKCIVLYFTEPSFSRDRFSVNSCVQNFNVRSSNVLVASLQRLQISVNSKVYKNWNLVYWMLLDLYLSR